MSKQTEALKLALEALEGLEALLLSMGLTHLIVYGDAEKAITNLQKELEDQPAQQTIHCKHRRENNGVCPHHNLQCGWPKCNEPEQPVQQQEQDIPDLIAGALGVSRGTAYDLMREALAAAQQEPLNRLDVACDIKTLCAIGDLPDSFEEVADWIADGSMPAQQQEPVAEVKLKERGGNAGIATVIHEIFDPMREPLRVGDKLYASPPASKPLTDEQIIRLVPGLYDCLCDPYDCDKSGDDYASIPKDMIRLARAIEAAHGITGEQK